MDLREFIERIAQKAGEISLKYYNSPTLDVRLKSNKTPVTQADEEAEQYLRAEIKQAFPEDSIIGEEFGDDARPSPRRWILDPIDGTKTFMRGVPFYGTLIAVESEGEVSHGCVFLPALNELVYAERGNGCFWNNRRCHVSQTKNLEDATIVTTDAPQLEARIPQKRLGEFTHSVKLWRTWGDCYGHVLVATGRADGMLDPQCAVWDVGPLSVIIEEAGGSFSSFNGERTIRGGDLITGNPKIHEALKSFVNQSTD